MKKCQEKSPDVQISGYPQIVKAAPKFFLEIPHNWIEHIDRLYGTGAQKSGSHLQWFDGKIKSSLTTNITVYKPPSRVAA